MNNKKSLMAFVDVFGQRLDKIKKKLEKELSKTKKERCRITIKKHLVDAKRLKKVILNAKNEHKKYCPHCNGAL